MHCPMSDFGRVLVVAAAQFFMVVCILFGGMYVVLEGVNLFVQATQSSRLPILSGPSEQRVFLICTAIEGRR